MILDDLYALIDILSEKLDEQTRALLSEDLINLKSTISNIYSERDDLQNKFDLKSKDYEEVLKVNGKLYQKIGVAGIVEETAHTEDNEVKEEIISIEEIINEKGEFINA